MPDLTLLCAMLFAAVCLSFALGAITTLINTLNSVPCQFCRQPVLKPASTCPHCGKDKVKP